jgi:DNA-binding NtrC family response regulator
MTDKVIHVWFWSPDPGFAQIISRTLGSNFEVRHCEEFSREPERQLQEWWDVVLVDFRAADVGSGMEPELQMMNDLNQLTSTPPLIVMLAGEKHEMTLKVMESGAYDTVTCPPDMVELRLILRRAYKFRQVEKELYDLRTREGLPAHLHELIGASEGMQRVFGLAQKIAPCDVNVLVTGETGTGKELLARAIHRLSPRAESPFVAFSCASLPETLVEDELFGHEKGAFTGAVMARRGRFEVADRGTLFLDEVGDLGLGLQAKLLRVLQERSFERLGSNTSLTTDIRLICATHRDLPKMVEEGKFREDLFYRLNVVALDLPPLRERRDDIPFLAHHFLQRFASRFNKQIKRFTRLALHALEEHHWPGNVRELENVIQRAVVLAEGSKVDMVHLPGTLQDGFERVELSPSYEKEVREFKRRLILRTLRECGWSKQDAARSLSLARSYLHRLINQLEIGSEEEDAGTELLDDSSASDRIM